MSIEGLSLLRVRLILAAIIAVILLHAMPAAALPHHREHGSAFSASTSEVALLVRQDSVEKLKIGRHPLPLPIIDALAPVAILVIPLHFRGKPFHQRGPPFVACVLSPHAAPRAPPIRI